MGKIILAVDESDNSTKAWEFYRDRLSRADDEVIIVHVAELSLGSVHRVSMERAHPGTHSLDAVTPTMLGGIVTEAQTSADSVTSSYQKLVQAKQIPCQIISDLGKPGECIVKHASDNAAVMVIMGTRGQSKFRRTLIGSVSDYVLRHASCPVVVVRE